MNTLTHKGKPITEPMHDAASKLLGHQQKFPLTDQVAQGKHIALYTQQLFCSHKEIEEFGMHTKYGAYGYRCKSCGLRYTV